MPHIMKRPRVRVTVDADAYDDLYDEYSLVIQANDALAKRVEECRGAEELTHQVGQMLGEHVDIANYLLDLLLERKIYPEPTMVSDAKTELKNGNDGENLASLTSWLYYNSFLSKQEIENAKCKAEERLGSSFSVFEAIAREKLEEKRREIFEKARKELEEEKEAEECSQPAE